MQNSVRTFYLRASNCQFKLYKPRHGFEPPNSRSLFKIASILHFPETANKISLPFVGNLDPFSVPHLRDSFLQCRFWLSRKQSQPSPVASSTPASGFFFSVVFCMRTEACNLFHGYCKSPGVPTEYSPI